MQTFPTDANGIIFRQTAIDRGFTDNQLARAVENKQIERIWPGAFLPKQTLTREERHKRTAIAAGTLSGGSTALADESAAVLHGLSLLNARWNKVHVASGLKSGGRIDKRKHIHSGPLDAADVVTVEGVKVTSLEQTAVSIACSRGFYEALAVFDSALRLGADRDVMAGKLESYRPGVLIGRRGLHYANGKSENAGESWGRGQIIDDGLPIPDLQQEFHDREGEFIGRCDYAWSGKLVAEFDGMRKYQGDLRKGESPFDAMKREKVREDALRRIGVMVIRWIWADLKDYKVAAMVREWLDQFGLLAA